MRRDESLAQADQFEERAVELDDVVLGAPGMPVAGADLEAEAAVKRRLLGKIMGGDDEMVDGARHEDSSRDQRATSDVRSAQPVPAPSKSP